MVCKKNKALLHTLYMIIEVSDRYVIYIFDTDVVKEIAGPFDVTMTRAQTKQTSDFPICALRILEHFSFSKTLTFRIAQQKHTARWSHAVWCGT